MYKLPNPVNVVRTIGKYASARLPENIDYRRSLLAVPAGVGIALAACGSGGNGDVSKITPNSTNTRPAVTRTYTPTPQPTAGPTKELDYCDPEAVEQRYGARPLGLTEADGFNVAFNELNKYWSTEVNLGDGPAIYQRFGEITSAIYRSTINDLNRQLAGKAVLDSGIDFLTIRVTNETIKVSQTPNGEGTVIPLNDLPKDFVGSLEQKTSNPSYCRIV